MPPLKVQASPRGPQRLVLVCCGVKRESQRDGSTSAEGAGIGGGVGQGPEGYSGHVTFYVEVPDVDGELRCGGGPFTS